MTRTRPTNSERNAERRKIQRLEDADMEARAQRGVDTSTATSDSAATAVVANNLATHIADTANPHSVTKSQVGLANVDNTSDVNKPVSTAQAAAIAAAVAGLAWKQYVRVATTAAGTLATSFENGDSVDGVTLATGDRILIKDQAAGAENGIYTVNASGAPTRATDADTGAEMVNASVYVSEGTVNADTQWTCTTNATITLGTTALTFTRLSTGGGVSSGASNPGAPATNDLFYRTDLKLLIVYDGTRWLSVDEVTIPCVAVNAIQPISATGNVLWGEVRSDFGLYLTRFVCTTSVNTTNDGSKFWTVKLQRFPESGAGVDIVSFSTGTTPDTAGSIYRHDQAINAVLDSTARLLLVRSEKTSTPGTFTCTASVKARLIVT